MLDTMGFFISNMTRVEQAPHGEFHQEQQLNMHLAALLNQETTLGILVSGDESLLRERILAMAFPSERENLTTVMNLATQLHQGQQRENGMPYVVHPLGITLQFLQKRRQGLYVSTIKLHESLLHDTKEDWKGSPEEYDRIFFQALSFPQFNPIGVKKLHAFVDLFDKHTHSDTESYLQSLADQGYGSLKIMDRLNSAYGDQRRTLDTLLAEQDPTIAQQREKRSQKKLHHMRWFRDTTPKRIVDDLEMAIAVSDFLTDENFRQRPPVTIFSRETTA